MPKTVFVLHAFSSDLEVVKGNLNEDLLQFCAEYLKDSGPEIVIGIETDNKLNSY